MKTNQHSDKLKVPELQEMEKIDKNEKLIKAIKEAHSFRSKMKHDAKQLLKKSIATRYSPSKSKDTQAKLAKEPFKI